MNDPLADIFNASIKFGIFPEKVKTSKNTPIFESRKKKLLNNYRPTISFKIPERIMYNRVQTHLGEYS